MNVSISQIELTAHLSRRQFQVPRSLQTNKEVQQSVQQHVLFDDVCVHHNKTSAQSNSLTENRNPAHGRPEVRDGTWHHRVTPRACTGDANFIPDWAYHQTYTQSTETAKKDRPVTPHRRSRSRPRNLRQKRPGSRRQRRRDDGATRSEGQTPD